MVNFLKIINMEDYTMTGVDIFVGVMIALVMAAFVWVWWLDKKEEK